MIRAFGRSTADRRDEPSRADQAGVGSCGEPSRDRGPPCRAAAIGVIGDRRELGGWCAPGTRAPRSVPSSAPNYGTPSSTARGSGRSCRRDLDGRVCHHGSPSPRTTTHPRSLAIRGERRVTSSCRPAAHHPDQKGFVTMRRSTAVTTPSSYQRANATSGSWSAAVSSGVTRPSAVAEARAA